MNKLVPSQYCRGIKWQLAFAVIPAPEPPGMWPAAAVMPGLTRHPVIKGIPF
jgi:hypothetical protein